MRKCAKVRSCWFMLIHVDSKNHFDCWDRRTVSTKTNTVSLGPGKHHQEGACWKRHMTAIYIYINHGQIMYYHVIFANWSHDLMFLVSSKTKLPTYPFDIFKAAISETRHYDITMRHSVQTILTQHTFRLSCLAEHLVTGFLGDRNQDLTNSISLE
jgi:hypothetical protein